MRSCCGRKLATLLDAATYAAKLPKEEADTAEWHAAIESLMLVAELGGPTKFSRIGVMRALNVERILLFGTLYSCSSCQIPELLLQYFCSFIVLGGFDIHV